LISRIVGFSGQNVEDDALLRVLALDAQVLEVRGIPERVEVALDGDRIVGVAGVGKEARQDGLLGDAPVADDANLLDRLRCWAKAVRRRQPTEQHAEQPATAPDGCLESAQAREMEVCLIFTGLEPCGEHKYWCGP
jgi:hypothetical protein